MHFLIFVPAMEFFSCIYVCRGCQHYKMGRTLIFIEVDVKYSWLTTFFE